MYIRCNWHQESHCGQYSCEVNTFVFKFLYQCVMSLNGLSFASARLRWKPVLSVRGFKNNFFQQLDTVTVTTGQTCIYELSLNVKEHQEHYLDIPSNGTPSCCNEYSAA